MQKRERYINTQRRKTPRRIENNLCVLKKPTDYAHTTKDKEGIRQRTKGGEKENQKLRCREECFLQLEGKTLLI